MNDRARGYVKVAATGRARFFRPMAGRWTGGAVEVRVARETQPGWYRARCEFTRSGPMVTMGRGVCATSEASRLETMAARPLFARTRKPGIVGFQHMEDMANASIAARKQAQRHFAQVLLSDGGQS